MFGGKTYDGKDVEVGSACSNGRMHVGSSCHGVTWR